MFKIFSFVCALIFVIAAIKVQAMPAGNQAYVVNYTNVQNPDGYQYNVQLSDYSSKQETGMLEEVENEDGEKVWAMKATGGYQFIAPDGTINTVTYVADKNGFRPEIRRAYVNTSAQNQAQIPQTQAPAQAQPQAPAQAQTQAQTQAQNQALAQAQNQALAQAQNQALAQAQAQAQALAQATGQLTQSAGNVLRPLLPTF